MNTVIAIMTMMMGMRRLRIKDENLSHMPEFANI